MSKVHNVILNILNITNYACQYLVILVGLEYILQVGEVTAPPYDSKMTHPLTTMLLFLGMLKVLWQLPQSCF